MIQTTATEQSNKQPDDKVIRSPHGNVSEAELTEFQRCIHILCVKPAKSRRSRVILTSAVVIGIAIALHPLSASAQTAREFKGATPLVAIQDESPAKLIVDPRRLSSR